MGGVQQLGRVGRVGRLGAVAVALVAAGCSSSEPDDTSAPTTAPATAGPSTTRVTESPACAGTGARPALERLYVQVGETPRSASVHLPAGGGSEHAPPVVVSFHGAGASAATMAVQDGLDAIADAEGFVVLRPDGLMLTLDSDPAVHDITWWDVSGRAAADTAFVDVLLDELGRRVCIDPSRVYATGFSVGAEMAMAAACALPDQITAFAQVEAGRAVPCDAGRPTPALAFHGTDDLVAPYAGRPTDGFLAAEDLMAAQAVRNGCDTDHDVRSVSSTVEVVTWAGCEAPTVLYRLAGHGHAWPGHPLPFAPEILVGFLRGADGQPNAAVTASGLTIDEFAANLLLTNTDLDATDVMWDFFAAARDSAEP